MEGEIQDKVVLKDLDIGGGQENQEEDIPEDKTKVAELTDTGGWNEKKPVQILFSVQIAKPEVDDKGRGTVEQDGQGAWRQVGDLGGGGSQGGFCSIYGGWSGIDWNTVWEDEEGSHNVHGEGGHEGGCLGDQREEEYDDDDLVEGGDTLSGEVDLWEDEYVTSD